jgi:poly(ribitol-phosphate) beta-N-acetylglucosaminyltransferase
LYDLVKSHVGLIERLPTAGGFADWKQIATFADMAAETAAVFEQKKNRPYSRMYSRAQWPASHFAAALFKVRRPEIEWTAEFSDPLLIDTYGHPRPNSCDMAWLAEHRMLDAIRDRGFAADPAETRLFYWCEMLPYTLADRIVFINESQLTYMLSYCRDEMVRRAIREKAEISAHPVPHAWAKAGDRTWYLDDECVNLAYFGTIYTTRSLSMLFAGIAALSGQERLRIRLYVFTRQTEQMQAEVDACGLWDVVFVLPEMDYLTFLRSLDDFDALVVNDVDRESAAGVNPYLPSKLSDYATSKTPILAIHERGSELSKRPEPTYWCEIQQPDAFLSRMLQVIREILSTKPAKTQR